MQAGDGLLHALVVVLDDKAISEGSVRGAVAEGAQGSTAATARTRTARHSASSMRDTWISHRAHIDRGTWAAGAEFDVRVSFAASPAA